MNVSRVAWWIYITILVAIFFASCAAQPVPV